MAPKVPQFLRRIVKKAKARRNRNEQATVGNNQDRVLPVRPTETTALLPAPIETAPAKTELSFVDQLPPVPPPTTQLYQSLNSPGLHDNSIESDKTETSEASARLQFNRGNLSQSLRNISQRIQAAVAEHTGSIGYLGSFAICVNTLTGPAMLELPAAYAESGFIPTTVTLFFVCFLSAFCSLHMANCISKVPYNRLSNNDEFSDEENPSNNNNFLYNHDYKREMEFSSVFSYYWGYQPWFYITHFLFWGCITCLNISSIVDTSQVVDTILGHTTGSMALQLDLDNIRGTWVFWNPDCSDEELTQGTCLPFSDSSDKGILLTAGTLITNISFFPLALMDLQENAAWQSFAFLVLLLASLYFVVTFTITIITSNNDEYGFTMPTMVSASTDESRGGWNVADTLASDEFLWGYSWNNLFGVVLFNFSLVIAVPAWLYERESHVDVPKVIYGSSFIATFLYIAIGCLGRLAMPHVSSNMLASLMSGAYGIFMQFVASFFAFFIVGLGIPLFSVLARLNLIGATSPGEPPVCSRPFANLLAVYLPFGVSWLLYDGKYVTELLSWGGTLLTSIVAFILPLGLALYVVKNSDAPGAVDVYGGAWSRSLRAEKISLRILFGLAVLSITAAILGNII